MKANGAKRKIFSDAVDLLAGAEEVCAVENGIRMLPIDSISPFRRHPFRLYEGERLEDMVESIREHGVLNPVIVWQEGDGYEMLAGHNRQVAAVLAERYEKVSSQGRRNDILEEIARLNGQDTAGTCPICRRRSRGWCPGLRIQGRLSWMRRRRSASGAWRGR